MKSVKNKEIVFLIKLMSGGGAERVISLLSHAAIENGHSVRLIVTHQHKDEIMLENIDKNINVISLPDEVGECKPSTPIMICARFLGKLGFKEKSSVFKYRARNSNTVTWLKKYFRKHKNSVAVAFIYDSIFLTLLAKHKTTKVVISERGDPAQYIGNKITAAFINNEFQKADNIVFQSPDVQKWYLENTPVRGTVIFNPVKPDLPEPYCGERKKRIVNFCRISPEKNLIMLIDAFSEFQNIFSEYELYIFGDAIGECGNNYINTINEHIKTLNCQNAIHVMPFQNNIHALINDYSMFVSSSDFEGMSNSMLEAMAIGLPCVCTDCPAGGARAVIKDGENGLLTPVGDSHALYLAMKKVAENPELANKLSQNSIRIRKEQSVDKIIKKWMELING